MATAKLFASHGAKILVVDINEDAAKITAQAIVRAGGEASIFVADVAVEADCKALVEAAIERYGKLDILMNSVGIGGPGVVTEIEEEFWNRIIDVDLKSMVFISKYAIPHMAENGGGSIINVASVDGMRAAMTRNIPYAAAKGGMIAASRVMAVHHGRQNIRVNCIAPGMIHTSMVEHMPDERREIRRKLAPLGTEGRAEDIAMAALFFASDESRWVSGVLMPVDAGLMAAGPQSVLNNVIEGYEYT